MSFGGLSACAPLVLGGAAAGVASVAQERSIGDGFDDFASDLEIKQKYAEVELDAERRPFKDVDVTVYEGRVLLTGTAVSDQDRNEAKKLAWTASHVAEVIDEIVVGPKTTRSQGLNDGWIDSKLRAKLTADRKVKALNYEIAVSQGAVYVLGLARSQEELDRLTDYARTLRGVRKVVSHVQFVTDPDRRLR